MQIVPMRDLKNTVEIEKRCAEGEPVFVTKNGYGRLVVMSIEHYEKNMREIHEAKAILDGLKDMNEEDTLDGKTAISKLREKYEI